MLRGGGMVLRIGFLGLVAIGLLINTLPEASSPTTRNTSLVLGGGVLLIGLVRFMMTPMTAFDAWMQAWLIGPGALTILWVSSPPVTAWSTRNLSLNAIEYGLARNQRYGPRLRAFGAHLVLLHFVVLTLLPLLWILDIALSPGTPWGSLVALTGEHFSTMLGSEAFWTWMRNSLIVSIGTTLLGLVVAIPAGRA